MADSVESSADKVKEKPWQRVQRMRAHDINKGSRYGPFSIEPMPHFRFRLDPKMSPEDRALRKQWVLDQRLSPSEPRAVPEVTPLNVFRRIYKAPLNAVEKALAPALGASTAFYLRWLVPKGLMLAATGYFALYYLKFHPNNWERKGGWHVYWRKQMQLPGQTPVELKKYDDFNDGGFKTRTALRDGKTSSA